MKIKSVILLVLVILIVSCSSETPDESIANCACTRTITQFNPLSPIVVCSINRSLDLAHAFNEDNTGVYPDSGVSFKPQRIEKPIDGDKVIGMITFLGQREIDDVGKPFDLGNFGFEVDIQSLKEVIIHNEDKGEKVSYSSVIQLFVNDEMLIEFNGETESIDGFKISPELIIDNTFNYMFKVITTTTFLEGNSILVRPGKVRIRRQQICLELDPDKEENRIKEEYRGNCDDDGSLTLDNGLYTAISCQ